MNVTPTSVKNISKRLSSEDTAIILKSMAGDTTLRLRNMNAYQIFGPGVWLLQAKSIEHLKSLKPSKAIYVPMGSLDMFFTDDKIMKETIDPRIGMFVGATYIVPEGKNMAYIVSKATFNTSSSQQKRVIIETTPPVVPKINVPAIQQKNGNNGITPISVPVKKNPSDGKSTSKAINNKHTFNLKK